ncbi:MULTISPECIES: hypothetical protein [Cupriavidus]
MKVAEILNQGAPGPELLDEVMLTTDGVSVEVLREGRKWVSGRFERNIGIDQPTHLAVDGQQHAHIYGRKGQELGVVNLDGTGSHGSKFKLHDDDATELRRRGFNVRPDNIVEWVQLNFPLLRVLFG